jgi:Zn-dependent metalloprotease
MSLTPKLLSFAVLLALGGTAAAANTSSPAVGRAFAQLQAHGSAVHASPHDRFFARDVIVDADGTEHVRFERTYAGLPVIGGDFVVHSRNGRMSTPSQTLRGAIKLDLRPAVGQSEAAVSAGAEFGSNFQGAPKVSAVVYARGASPVLAWRVQLANDDADMTYVVDANSGKVLDRWSNLETAGATGTGKTIYSGNQSISTNSISGGYEMRDTVRGGTYTTDFNNGSSSKPGTGTIFTDADNVWGNNTNSDRASAGADAHFGLASTWDFYGTLGRNGIDNTGRGSYSRTHVGKNYVNAFWSDSCFCMSYGDGDGKTYGPLVTLDVAGHEVSHGVTSTSADLVYSGESGGLNEATSDIMGSMVEFYANNSLDTPDYMVGEEIYLANVSGSSTQKALRYMWRPNKDGSSADCWYSGIGSIDVHYSSGPANHFFYLLAEGTGAKSFSGVDHTPTTCKAGDTKAGTGSASLAGIGRDAATRIWYRALSTYMTSNTNYAGARTATLQAAADLYGSASTQYNAVAAAWSAVLVN